MKRLITLLLVLGMAVATTAYAETSAVTPAGKASTVDKKTARAQVNKPQSNPQKRTLKTPRKGKYPMVKLTTNFGAITLELNAEKAPITVANFLQYVNDGFYNGTIFHRVIADFMIQGGGFEPGMNQKTTRAQIKNEAANGLTNDIYTIAMARTGEPHSASAQFFINTSGNNSFLNFRAPTPQEFGYCVFGHVVEGKDVVDQIRKVKTGSKGMFQDVPVEDVVILKAEVI